MDLEGLGLLPKFTFGHWISDVTGCGDLFLHEQDFSSALSEGLTKNLIFVVVLEEVGSPHQTQNLLEW